MRRRASARSPHQTSNEDPLPNVDCVRHDSRNSGECGEVQGDRAKSRRRVIALVELRRESVPGVIDPGHAQAVVPSDHEGVPLDKLKETAELCLRWIRMQSQPGRRFRRKSDLSRLVRHVHRLHGYESLFPPGTARSSPSKLCILRYAYVWKVSRTILLVGERCEISEIHCSLTELPRRARDFAPRILERTTISFQALTDAADRGLIQLVVHAGSVGYVGLNSETADLGMSERPSAHGTATVMTPCSGQSTRGTIP